MSITSAEAATEIARDLNIPMPGSMSHVAGSFEAKRDLVKRIAVMPFSKAARLLMLHAWQRDSLNIASLHAALLAELHDQVAANARKDQLIAEKDVLIEELRACGDIRVGRLA